MKWRHHVDNHGSDRCCLACYRDATRSAVDAGVDRDKAWCSFAEVDGARSNRGRAGIVRRKAT